MNNVSYYPLAITSAMTSTSQIYVGQSDNMMLFVPSIANVFRSAVMTFRLNGSPNSTVTALTCSFYDYSNKTPAECVITVSTGGLYELPAPGPGLLSVQWDTTTTNATTIYLMTSKVTF